ncbi:hypothetical protein TNCV_761011 [Trichonephila clavipes]|nr:hypothetical protein TNCV_2789311 [Trichonephila clavipes]GFX75633.1 hypothetical protein TNCV_761011 [Trichonephila clavipes]
MGRTILLERRQSESVGRRNSRSTFLRSDWPFARREVGVEMDWVDPNIKDPRQGDLELAHIKKLGQKFFDNLSNINNVNIQNLENYDPNIYKKRPRRILLDSYNPP